jgi:hypothetical protein
MNLLACLSLPEFVMAVALQNAGWLFVGGLFVAAVAACIGAGGRNSK